MIYSLSGISGAHINPAVTLGFLVRRDIHFIDAVGYWIAQFAGAGIAGYILLAIYGPQIVNGTTSPQSGFSWATALAMEIMLSFILVFVILSTSHEEAVVGKNVAIAVGFTVALCGLFGGAVSGASMNPARSFGPALASGDWTDYWIYVAGPCAAALLAAACSYIHRSGESPQRRTVSVRTKFR